jgi:hypothetical protein
MRTEEGIALLHRRLGAIGRFCTTPFLVPMHGVSEMSQGFCRASAVSGTIFMLDTAPERLRVGVEDVPAPEPSTGDDADVAATLAVDAVSCESPGDATVGDAACVGVGDKPGVAAEQSVRERVLVLDTSRGFSIKTRKIIASPEYFAGCVSRVRDRWRGCVSLAPRDGCCGVGCDSDLTSTSTAAPLHVARCVCVTDGMLVPGTERVLVVVPPGVAAFGNAHPVFIVEQDSSAGTAPRGLTVVHLAMVFDAAVDPCGDAAVAVLLSVRDALTAAATVAEAAVTSAQSAPQGAVTEPGGDDATTASARSIDGSSGDTLACASTGEGVAGGAGAGEGGGAGETLHAGAASGAAAGAVDGSGGGDVPPSSTATAGAGAGVGDDVSRARTRPTLLWSAVFLQVRTHSISWHVRMCVCWEPTFDVVAVQKSWGSLSLQSSLHPDVIVSAPTTPDEQLNSLLALDFAADVVRVRCSVRGVDFACGDAVVSVPASVCPCVRVSMCVCVPDAEHRRASGAARRPGGTVLPRCSEQRVSRDAGS